jgi:hypothetical protein
MRRPCQKTPSEGKKNDSIGSIDQQKYFDSSKIQLDSVEPQLIIYTIVHSHEQEIIPTINIKVYQSPFPSLEFNMPQIVVLINIDDAYDFVTLIFTPKRSNDQNKNLEINHSNVAVLPNLENIFDLENH